ncbi:MAG: hypothetical protein ACI841_000191 [Planctomycetota bacterium]|jgi:hypothetical protein
MQSPLRWLFIALALLMACPISLAGGKVFMKVDQALKLAFPDCKVERGTLVLSKEQQARVKKLGGSESGSRIVHPYVATKDGKLVGTAYFDTHRVRTMRETLMVVVTPDGKVARTEMLAFGEPLDYLPSARWYAQFLSKELNADLQIKRKIKGIAGATLSAKAATACVRRALAIHKVSAEKKPKPKPEPQPKKVPDKKDSESHHASTVSSPRSARCKH